MVKIRRQYEILECTPVLIEPVAAILAASVNNNSTVSSVGQKIGTEVTFEADAFVNNSWETGPLE